VGAGAVARAKGALKRTRIFGNHSSPRRNLTTGGILLVVSSFSFGTTGERLIWATRTSWVDYIFLALWGLLLLTGIKIFRLGLASVPPDPKIGD
jgi:hypothetical protein